MLAIIGSLAMNHWVKPEHARNPNDLDIVGTYDEIQSFVRHIKRSEKVTAQYPFEAGSKIFIKTTQRIIEAEVAWDNSNSEVLHQLINIDGVQSNINGFKVMICPLPLLYTLK